MSKKHTIFLLLGSNIYPRTVYLNKAIGFIDKSLGEIISVSSVYESEPWGFEASVAFLNRVVRVESAFEPLEILKRTQEIERLLGRTTKTNGGMSPAPWILICSFLMTRLSICRS